jgi:carbamoyltransferase
VKILGLSAFHSNAAAALVVDGECVGAAQEERFSLLPRDASFPLRAARHVLAQAGVDPAGLDRVVFYEKPLRRFERLLVHQLRNFPAPANVFARTMFTWLGDRLWLKNRIANELGVDADRVLFTGHQQAHAASAFLASPFEEAAVLVVDGAGERTTTSLARGMGSKLEMLAEIPFPHSLGLFVSAFTQLLGFEPDRDEHLFEALAAYGACSGEDAAHLDAALAELLPLAADGSYRVTQADFRFAFDHERLFGPGLERRFGAARIPGAPLELAAGGREVDLAASVQRRVEEALLGLARELKRRVPVDALCVAGAFGLNRTAMGRLAREGPFAELYVQPAADDAGAALGAALLAWHVENPGVGARPVQRASLGVETREASACAPGAGPAPVDPAERAERAARTLCDGGLVGWVQGRSGFGRGSGGARACFARPDADVRARLNRGLAPREAFLPLPIAVRAERAGELLDAPAGAAAALRDAMLAVPARAALRAAAPAVVAPDGTVAPRVVPPGDAAGVHALLAACERAGAPPVLVELELAPRGEPAVRGEREALALFARSELDLLVVGDRIYARGEA